MQYDLHELSKATKVSLTWHGEDTRVDLGDGKVTVKTGETIEADLDTAKYLLRYSHKWTLKGDKPVVHGYEKIATKEEKEEQSEVELTVETVSKMKKDELVKACEELELDSKGTVPELKERLLDYLEGETDEGDETDETDEGDDEGDDEQDDEGDDE